MRLTPGRFISQPQSPARIWRGNELSSGIVSAFVFDSPGVTCDRVSGTLYPLSSSLLLAYDTPGRVLRCTNTAGSYFNTGLLKLGGVDLFCSAGNPWSVVIYARLIISAVGGTFIAKASATTSLRQFAIFRDTASAPPTPGIYLRGTLNETNWNYNTAAWHQYTVTWDGAVAKAYGDCDKETTLTVGTAVAEAEPIVFGARTSGTGFPHNGHIAYSYIYNRAITRTESMALYTNPWQVLQAPPRKMFLLPSSSLSHNIVISGIQQDTAISQPSISQIHSLSVGGAVQGVTASTPAISQVQQLIIQGANQPVEISEPSILLLGNIYLTIADTFQGITINEPAILQEHNIQISGLTQGIEISNPAITRNVNDLTIDGAEQGTTISSVAISQTFVPAWNEDSSTSNVWDKDYDAYSDWNKDSSTSNTWSTP